MRTPETRRGLVAGAVAGTVLVALMYLLGPLAGLRPLPQLLQQPILDIMPGAVFGFLIDNLQHAGKVVEEAGLIVGMVAGLAVLGGIYGYLRSRWKISYLAIAVAAAGWLIVSGILLPLSGDGWFGLQESLTAPLLWAVIFVAYAVILEGAYENWLVPVPATADPGRRQLLRAIPLAIAGVLCSPSSPSRIALRLADALTTPELTSCSASRSIASSIAPGSTTSSQSSLPSGLAGSKARSNMIA